MKSHFLIILMVFFSCKSEKRIDPLQEVVKSAPELVRKTIQSSKHEVQIIYTQVERDAQNHPHLYSFYINRDDNKYFYPASTVKMPVAFLALQRIHEISKTIPGVSIDSRIFHDSIRPPQRISLIDSTSATGYPSIRLFVEKIFSVSDNNAYNRLYEFLGQDYINEELQNKGVFRNSRIRTRVGISGFSTEENRYTNPIQIFDTKGVELYEQGELYAIYSQFDSLNDVKKGKAYYDDQLDRVVNEPFDMGEKNFINLTDLEASLQRVIFPELFSSDQGYDLSKNDYNFLYEIMPKTPLEFSFNQGHADEYYDSYVKFFYNGDSKEPIPKHIKIFNKVGWAYGTLTDCSYIIDTKNNIEFFLTATILVNENEIFNDGKYEYEEIGLPFFSALGKSVYEYDLKRKRKHSPDLSKFIR